MDVTQCQETQASVFFQVVLHLRLHTITKIAFLLHMKTLSLEERKYQKNNENSLTAHFYQCRKNVTKFNSKESAHSYQRELQDRQTWKQSVSTAGKCSEVKTLIAHLDKIKAVSFSFRIFVCFQFQEYINQELDLQVCRHTQGHAPSITQPRFYASFGLENC